MSALDYMEILFGLPVCWPDCSVCLTAYLLGPLLTSYRGVYGIEIVPETAAIFSKHLKNNGQKSP